MTSFMILLPDPSLLQYFLKTLTSFSFHLMHSSVLTLLLNSATQSETQYKAIRVWKKYHIKGHKRHKEFEHHENSLGKRGHFYKWDFFFHFVHSFNHGVPIIIDWREKNQGRSLNFSFVSPWKLMALQVSLFPLGPQ